jgi:hypothetical protein
MLPQFDADLVGWLMEKFSEIGIDVRTDNTVTGIERAGQELRVQTHMSRGMAEFSADLVVPIKKTALGLALSAVTWGPGSSPPDHTTASPGREKLQNVIPITDALAGSGKVLRGNDHALGKGRPTLQQRRSGSMGDTSSLCDLFHRFYKPKDARDLGAKRKGPGSRNCRGKFFVLRQVRNESRN